MSTILDRTQQRILGVLIEKELSVPDSYPLTENSLVLGCNQKNNREPVLALEEFEVHGALTALQVDGWVRRVERDGGRTARFRHEVPERLGVRGLGLALLAELLLRGPQTHHELRVRVERMGFHPTDAEVVAALEGMRDPAGHPLAELLPRQPRERDARYAHCLGPRDPATPAAPAPAEPKAAPPPRAVAPPDLAARVAELERRVAELELELRRARGTPDA
ncbi:MAG: DUF480 domain-containing protein [Planctomycetes bacterium]|nr:DUF480 domain-containing protein [Planctomycetota bacterium]